MSYATVTTAVANTALTDKVTLGLRRKAYNRIDNVANLEDQRELQACIRMFTDTAPTGWVVMVLLIMDATATLATATDAEIDTAVTTVWNRIKLVG